MKKRSKIALICVIAAIPLLLIAAFLLFALPYINAASSMPAATWAIGRIAG